MIRCCARWCYGPRNKSTGRVTVVANPRSLVMISRRGKYSMLPHCALTGDPRRIPAISLMLQVMRVGGFAKYSSPALSAISLNGTSSAVLQVLLSGVKWLSLIRRYWMILSCFLSGMQSGLKMLVPSNRSSKRSRDCFEMSCLGCR